MELNSFLELFPEDLSQLIKPHYPFLDVVLDYGRKPVIRTFKGDLELNTDPVTPELLNSIYSNLTFGKNNRAVISGALHRVSMLTDRSKNVVGLTMRFGNPIVGASDDLAKYLLTGNSLLLIGKPGSGKTVRLRDCARFLSNNDKRVMIVDTSGEICGDGPLPHKSVGRARRIIPSTPRDQAEAMIEAVENHTPDVVVVDEISNYYEVEAVRTITERGVQVIATAHAGKFSDIITNPTLCPVVGGCQSVILSDSESKKRSSRKAVVERKHYPGFNILVEILDFSNCKVYTNIAEAVDAFLLGEEVKFIGTGSCVTPVTDSEHHEPVKLFHFGLNDDYVSHAILNTGITCVDESKATHILTTTKRAGRFRDLDKYLITVKSNSKVQIENAIKGITKNAKPTVHT